MLWTPDNHLHPDKIAALKAGGIPPDQIEFLGWLSFCASAINANKHNPAKAAHTLLAKDSVKKMVPIFIQKKQESIHPKEVAAHDEVDEMFRQFNRWKQRNVPEAEEDTYAPEE
jgi:hypothetical protein